MHGESRSRPAAEQHGQKNAIIVNEYGWLWLNRDGPAATLTEKPLTKTCSARFDRAQRSTFMPLYLAAETEFWRVIASRRRVPLPALGYSRPDGQTSDHWKDIAKLKWEPEFYRYVRDAFAPVGLSINYWNATAVSGQRIQLPVRLINDLGQPWNGPVTLRVKCANRVLVTLKQEGRRNTFWHGDTGVRFDLAGNGRTLPPRGGVARLRWKPCPQRARTSTSQSMTTFTRRQWLRFGSSAAGVAALGGLTGCEKRESMAASVASNPAARPVRNEQYVWLSACANLPLFTTHDHLALRVRRRRGRRPGGHCRPQYG